MELASRGSVTQWMDQLRLGHQSAADELWKRYFVQLVSLANTRYHGRGRDRDEEDIALSALKSVFLGLQTQRFPDLNDRTGLWPLLVTITARKAINEADRQRAQKRNRGLEVRPTDENAIAATAPTPEFALMVVEEIDRLVALLGDETLRRIVALKLEGYRNEEIAHQLDVSVRTIVRKLHRIRQEWEIASCA